jgi:hypothetical protein
LRSMCFVERVTSAPRRQIGGFMVYGRSKGPICARDRAIFAAYGGEFREICILWQGKLL